jgi:CBS domain-containing protein
LKVRDCMTTEVATVRRETSLREIIKLFENKNYHALPVVDKYERLIGIVTFEDTLKVFQPYSQDLHQMLKTIPFIETPQEKILEADISPEMSLLVVADDILSTEIITISPDEDASRAYSLMRLHETDRLLVTEEDNLIGIITLFDLIYHLFKEKGIVQS